MIKLICVYHISICVYLFRQFFLHFFRIYGRINILKLRMYIVCRSNWCLLKDEGNFQVNINEGDEVCIIKKDR